MIFAYFKTIMMIITIILDADCQKSHRDAILLSLVTVYACTFFFRRLFYY